MMMMMVVVVVMLLLDDDRLVALMVVTVILRQIGVAFDWLLGTRSVIGQQLITRTRNLRQQTL